MLFIIFALGLANSLSLSSVIVLYSDSSPIGLLRTFSESLLQISVDSVNTDQLVSQIESVDFLLLVDITLQPHLLPLFDQISSNFDAAYLTISTPTQLSNYSPYRFYLHNFYENEASALIKISNYFEWTNFALLCSGETINLQLADSISKSSDLNVVSYLKYEKNLTQGVSDNILGRMVKAKGTSRIMIIDEGDSLNTIESSIVTKKINIDGNIILLPSRAIYSASVEGSLIVVESGLENSSSSDNYEYFAVIQGLSYIKSILDSLNLKIILPQSMRKILEKNFSTRILPHNYSLINIQNGQKIKVGELNTTLTTTKTIYYPGNTTDPSSVQSSIITFSLANGTSETFDLYQYYVISLIYQGAEVAASLINQKNEIPGYKIQLFPTNCGLFIYDPGWYYNCFSKIKKNMGVAYITSY